MLNHTMNNNQNEPHRNRPTDDCRKLKSGLARLKKAVQTEYESVFPGRGDSVERALAEAETLAWSTPFPSLFFPPLARISLNQIGAPSVTQSPYQP